MTTPNLGLALAAGPDTIAAALITKFDGNFSILDTVIGNKVDKGAPITNLITTTAVAGSVPLVAKGILLQSGNLFEARDSTDVVKANITPTGDIYIRGVLLVAAASPLSLISNVATEKPLLLKGFAAQSANLLEVQNSAATVLAAINATGAAVVDRVAAQPLNAANVVLQARGAASQTANILEIQNNSSAVIAGISANGETWAGSAAAILGSTGVGSMLSAQSRIATQTVLATKGAAAQSANLFEAQNSAGTELAGIDSGGKQRVSGTTPTTAVGAYYGYMTVTIIGIGDKKIQLFN